MNLARLKKSEIIWLSQHKCKNHGHTYLEHPGCIDRDKPEGCPVKERIGFLDIESGGSLTADFGYTFCYCILGDDGVMTERSVTTKEIRSYVFDEPLLRQFCKDVREYDRLVVYYGKSSGFRQRHDIPFLRTRCAKFGLDFPLYGEVKVTDAYDIVRGKFKLARNRMQTVCDFLGIPSKEHKLNPDIWMRALAGDDKSLKFITTHCREDVRSTAILYYRILDYANKTNTSI